MIEENAMSAAKMRRIDLVTALIVTRLRRPTRGALRWTDRRDIVWTALSAAKDILIGAHQAFSVE
jgi:hypothetical protein